MTNQKTFSHDENRSMKYVFIICTLFWDMTGISVAAPGKVQVMELLEGWHWSLDAGTFDLLGEGSNKTTRTLCLCLIRLIKSEMVKKNIT